MARKKIERKLSNGNEINRGGAPKGNLNAARSIVPALRRLASGQELPAYLQRVIALADREAGELVSDQGGLENMSGASRLMIGAWRSARAGELLVWHYLLKTGAAVQVDAEHKTWDLQPGLQRLANLLMAQHRVLVALGLERKAKPVQDLQTYLHEHYSETTEAPDGTGQSAAVGADEPVEVGKE